MAYVQGPVVRNERRDSLMDAGLRNIISGLSGMEESKKNERAQALASLKFGEEQGIDMSSPEAQKLYAAGDVTGLGRLEKTQKWIDRQNTQKKMLEIEQIRAEEDLRGKKALRLKTEAETADLNKPFEQTREYQKFMAENKAKASIELPKEQQKLTMDIAGKVEAGDEFKKYAESAVNTNIANKIVERQRGLGDKANPADDYALLVASAKVFNPMARINDESMSSMSELEGILGKVSSKINQLKTGQALEQPERENLLKAIYAASTERKNTFDKVNANWRRMAEQNKLDQNLIFKDDLLSPMSAPQFQKRLVRKGGKVAEVSSQQEFDDATAKGWR